MTYNDLTRNLGKPYAEYMDDVLQEVAGAIIPQVTAEMVRQAMSDAGGYENLPGADKYDGPEAYTEGIVSRVMQVAATSSHTLSLMVIIGIVASIDGPGSSETVISNIRTAITNTLSAGAVTGDRARLLSDILTNLSQFASDKLDSAVSAYRAESSEDSSKDSGADVVFINAEKRAL